MCLHFFFLQSSNFYFRCCQMVGASKEELEEMGNAWHGEFKFHTNTRTFSMTVQSLHLDTFCFISASCDAWGNYRSSLHPLRPMVNLQSGPHPPSLQPVHWWQEYLEECQHAQQLVLHEWNLFVIFTVCSKCWKHVSEAHRVNATRPHSIAATGHGGQNVQLAISSDKVTSFNCCQSCTHSVCWIAQILMWKLWLRLFSACEGRSHCALLMSLGCRMKRQQFVNQLIHHAGNLLRAEHILRVTYHWRSWHKVCAFVRPSRRWSHCATQIAPQSTAGVVHLTMRAGGTVNQYTDQYITSQPSESEDKHLVKKSFSTHKTIISTHAHARTHAHTHTESVHNLDHKMSFLLCLVWLLINQRRPCRLVPPWACACSVADKALISRGELVRR